MTKQIYHTWDKWECYKAGFYNTTPPLGMTKIDCLNKYAEILGNLETFENGIKKVFSEWKISCEQNLTNDSKNRIAWIGQAVVCILSEVPKKFSSGFYFLDKEKRKQADFLAGKYLKKWLDENKPKFQKIQFLKDTKDMNFGEILPDTFLIYKNGYRFPENKSGVEYMDFDIFKAKYFSLHINKLIILGLNKLITPQNRCNMVFDFMQTMTRNIEKVSVDHEPFIGEPWRVWYHFDITNQNNFNVPHGFAMETEWKHWFLRENETCRLSGYEIGEFLPSIYSDIETKSSSFIFYKIDDLEWYNHEKEKSLLKASPKLILNDLLKKCNKKYDIKLSYDSFKENKEFNLPDFGIYRFYAEENKRRQHIYNKIIGE